MTGDQLAHAARSLVGTPFRLHGRDPRHGLDCVGVIVAAFAGAGHKCLWPNGYALRTRSMPDIAAIASALGLGAADAPMQAGDIVMGRPGPCQVHFAIAVSHRSIVHAHAGLRKVVLCPLPADWEAVARWRLQPRTISTRI